MARAERLHAGASLRIRTHVLRRRVCPAIALVGCSAATLALTLTRGSHARDEQREAMNAPQHEARAKVTAPADASSACPVGMASIGNRFCIDQYEASLAEVSDDGSETAASPFEPVGGRVLRAESAPHVFPQAYISALEAEAACARSDKRLCTAHEWQTACMGPRQTVYGYGNTNKPRTCNDHGRSPVIARFGISGSPEAKRAWTWDKLNDPALNQMNGTLSKTGDHPGCTNGYGVFDMVGNLHEWVADAGGTFYGGYYQDVHLHGHGCEYKTTAHQASYHDYSTGFRCCADRPR